MCVLVSNYLKKLRQRSYYLVCGYFVEGTLACQFLMLSPLSLCPLDLHSRVLQTDTLYTTRSDRKKKNEWLKIEV